MIQWWNLLQHIFYLIIKKILITYFKTLRSGIFVHYHSMQVRLFKYKVKLKDTGPRGEYKQLKLSIWGKQKYVNYIIITLIQIPLMHYFLEILLFYVMCHFNSNSLKQQCCNESTINPLQINQSIVDQIVQA